MWKVLFLAIFAVAVFGLGLRAVGAEVSAFPSPGAFPDVEHQAFFKANGITVEQEREASRILQQALWDIQDNIDADWMEAELKTFNRFGKLRALLRLSRAEFSTSFADR